MLEHYDESRDERRDAVVVKLKELTEEALAEGEFTAGLLLGQKPEEKP